MVLTGIWALAVLFGNKIKAMFYETDIIMTSKGGILNCRLRLIRVKTKTLSESLYNSNIRALRSAYITINKVAATSRDRNHSHFCLTNDEMAAGPRNLLFDGLF